MTLSSNRGQSPSRTKVSGEPIYEGGWEEVCSINLASPLPKYFLDPFPVYSANTIYQQGDLARVVGKCGNIEYVYVALEQTSSIPTDQSTEWSLLYCAGNGKQSTCKKRFECGGTRRVIDLGHTKKPVPSPCSGPKSYCGERNTDPEKDGLICVPVEGYDVGRDYGSCPVYSVEVLDGFTQQLGISFDPGLVIT